MASVDDAGSPIVDLMEPCHECTHVLADHGAQPYDDECFMPCQVPGCKCADFEPAYEEEA